MVRLAPYNHDAYIGSLASPPAVLNKLSVEENGEWIDQQILTELTSDVISMKPTCACGELTGGLNLGRKCKCGSIVEKKMGSTDPTIVMAVPDGVDYWVNVDFLTTLMYATGFKKNLVRWFGDTSYNPEFGKVFAPERSAFNRFKEMEGFERTYSWFVKNLADIIYEIAMAIPEKKKRNTIISIMHYYKEYEPILKSKLVPIVNKQFNIKEKTITGSFITDSVVFVNDIVMSFMLTHNHKSLKVRERITAKTLGSLVMLNMSLTRVFLGGKPGASRKHLFGARSSFSARGVITPIIGKHKYDEVHLPWGMSVVLLRPYLINILYKIRPELTYLQISRKLFRAVTSFDSDVSEAFDYLLADMPNNAITIVLQRNPSQGPQAALRLKCPFIKRKVSDLTVSLSGMIVGIPNGDFDGDECNIKLAEDLYMVEEMNKLDPAYIIPNTDDGTIFGKIDVSKPVTINMASAMKYQRDHGMVKKGV